MVSGIVYCQQMAFFKFIRHFPSEDKKKCRHRNKNTYIFIIKQVTKYLICKQGKGKKKKKASNSLATLIMIQEIKRLKNKLSFALLTKLTISFFTNKVFKVISLKN